MTETELMAAYSKSGSVLGPPPPYNTDAWREWRRGGIGASDLPAILGIDPYGRTPYSVALEKRGLTPAQKETGVMSWGRRIQPLALEIYAEQTGRRVSNVTKPSTNPAYPRLYAHLDGRVRGERIGVEVKWAGQWDEPPRNVQAQVLGQIGLAKLDAIDVVRISPWAEPTITTIERDDAKVRDLLEFAQAWYERFVLTDEMPPMDGSADARRYLASLPVVDGTRAATLEQASLAGELLELRAEVKRLEAADALIANQLIDSMAGAEGLEGDGWRIAFRRTKDSTHVSWELIVAAYRRLLLDAGVEQDKLDTIIGLYTETRKGTRPFRLTAEKGN